MHCAYTYSVISPQWASNWHLEFIFWYECVSSARRPRLCLPHHQQRLHPVSSRPTASGTDGDSLTQWFIKLRNLVAVLDIFTTVHYAQSNQIGLLKTWCAVFVCASIRKGRSWSQNPTITVLICQRWNGKTLRKKWVVQIGTHLRPSQFSVFSLLYITVSVWCLSFQLRTAMVKGETGGMSLDVRTSVDKGVSTFALIVCQNNKRSCLNYYIRDLCCFFLFSFYLWGFIFFSFV